MANINKTPLPEKAPDFISARGEAFREGLYNPPHFGNASFEVESFRYTSGKAYSFPVYVKGFSSTTLTGGTLGTRSIAANAAESTISALIEGVTNLEDQAEALRVLKALNARGGSSSSASTKAGYDFATPPEVHGALPQEIEVTAFFKDKIINNREGRYIVFPYTEERDRFLEEVNRDSNPKTLQLPTLAPFLAVAGKTETIYSNQEGGIERVKITFARWVGDSTGYIPTGNGLQEISTNTRDASATIAISILDDMLLEYENSIRGFPKVDSLQVEAASMNMIQSISAKAKALKNTVMTAVGKVKGTIDKYVRQVSSLLNNISSLILLPSELLGQLYSSYQTLTDSIVGTKDRVDFMLSSIDLVLGNFVNTTEDVVAAFTGPDKMSITYAAANMTCQYTYACEAVSATSYDSVEEVEAARSSLLTQYGKIENILTARSEFGEMHSLLQALLASVLDFLNQQQARLPFVRKIDTGERVPLIVTAYNLYGDVGMEETLAARNFSSIKSRLYPPTTLEVLYETNV